MRSILSMLFCAAALVHSAGADFEGAEVLVPSTPRVETKTAASAPDSAIVAAPVLPAAVARDSALRDTTERDSAVRDSAASQAVPAAPKALVPAASAAPPSFIVTERRDTTRRVVAPVHTIAIAVDTAGASRNDRSTWAAVGLTLVLPGAGHRYLGHKTGAAVWMTADLVMWSALVIAWQMGDFYIEDATQIANRHAGASLGSDPEIAFLETMRDWRSRRPVGGRRDSYDEAMLQQGLAPDWRYPEDAAHDWDWGSPENPENNEHIAEFEDALKGYRTSRIALTYTAGALLLSRAIAVADILRIRRKSASRAGIQALVVPRLDGGQALLAYRF